MSKTNRRYLIAALILIVVEFTLFKLSYPFADFFGDSYSYIFAAEAHLDINIWPIGYSKFLEVFHRIASSDTMLVAFQYFTVQLAALYFFFTFRYLAKLTQNASTILFVFLFVSPLTLFFCNLINSDPPFAALSLFWFADLLWIAHRPKSSQLLTQGLALFAAFTVRHTAIYYPIITAAAFVLSKHSARAKWAGSLLGPLLMAVFILHERDSACKMYGFPEFSPMSGWLLANNSLYMYPDIHVDTSTLSSPQLLELNRLAKNFFLHAPSDFNDYLYDHSGSFFFHVPQSPLKVYAALHYPSTDDYTEVVGWGKVSPVYETFGKVLILHHPVKFFQDYVWLNTRKYFFPSIDKMKWYNMNSNYVDSIGAVWFKYPTNKVHCISKTAPGILLSPYPILFMLINLYLIACGAYFLSRKKIQIFAGYLKKLVLLSGLFLIVNFVFSVLVSVIVLRYEFFPMIVGIAISLLFLESMGKKNTQRPL